MLSPVIIGPALPFIFLILPNLFHFVTPQGPVTNGRVAYRCIDSGTYTGNHSAYRANLNALLASLPTKMDRSGFLNASAGPTPDRVNTAVLCRGDVDLDTCRECVRAAAVSSLNSCPDQKQAITWYRLCMLRYSDQPISGALATGPGVCLWNPFAASSEPQFWGALKRLVDEIRSKAVNGGQGRRKKVAVGRIAGPDFQTLFALAECTPDLEPRDCNECLLNATGDITECCNLRRGCRIHKPSCNLRYEIFHFFNESRLEESAYVPLLPDGNKGHNIAQIFIVVGVSIAAGLVVAVFIGILCRMNRKQNSRRKIEGVANIRTPEPLEYDFKTIKAATNGFSEDNKLGKGGFAIVYKGTFPNGLEIAVKRLSKDSGQGSNSEFKNEVRILARLLHRNLVRLLGFCEEGMEKLLVYEFVPNGSLDHFIFDVDPSTRWVLDWDRRFKIIWGIAQGLLYLHEDSQLKIIHSNLKASNVLLDKDMVPKISDFSLARLLEDETHEYATKIVETHGYMAPEHATHEKISVKSDVFSFGVLVLEIISGRKNNYAGCQESTHDLLNFVWKNWCDGSGVNVVDNSLRCASDSMSDIVRCIQMGLLCVQRDAASRPTMASVVLMLGSLSMNMAIPSEPAFCIPGAS